MVVVEEAGGAVETERGGWEVGGTAKDERENNDVADLEAIGNNNEECSTVRIYTYLCK